jgi:hypothetical protein
MLLAAACATTPLYAADATTGGSQSVDAQAAPLKVYPPGDMQGRRRWLAELLRTQGAFTDHQVAEFKANIAAMSPDEVQNVKYTDASIKQFKDEVAQMNGDEVRQLLKSWQRDTSTIAAEAKSEAARRQQQVEQAKERQREVEQAQQQQREFAVKSIGESDRRIAAERETAREEAEQARQDALQYRYYDPVGRGYWGAYYRNPWYRPYYGPYR